jgi:putative ABC transport system substrate-binding protein
MLEIRRREFILGGAAAWPLAARAQQQTKPTIGWLDTRPEGPPRLVIEAFRRGLAEAGFLEGRDVTVEYPTDDRFDRLPTLERRSALAADLVLRKVAVIVANTGSAALAAKAATGTVPVVFVIGGDPVELGLVPSFNRPAGNVTGVAVLGNAIAAKRFELLHKLVPASESIAMLVGRADAPYDQAEARTVQTAARTLGLRLLLYNITTDSELVVAFASLVERQAGAVLLGSNVPSIASRTNQIISLAARYAVPTMFFRAAAARAGGLSSYGPLLSENYRVASAYVGRILKGEKPADLPVQPSTRFEFVINLKTARALGLTIPPTLLALADEVIE